MMNSLGKTLVLIHTALCLLGLFWVTALYLSFVDWGWKEPRRVDIRDEADKKAKKEGPAHYRIASEIDQRVAALKEAARSRDLVLPAVAKNQAAWKRVAEQFPQNHLFYVNELARLNNAPDLIDIKAIQYQGADPLLDTPGIGAPRLADIALPVNKSFKTYVDELKKEMDNNVEEAKNTKKWLMDADKVTAALLSTKDDKGKTEKVGLYELQEREYEAQRQAKFEKEYLQPNWSRALEEAELFRERRVILEETLDRLKNRKK